MKKITKFSNLTQLIPVFLSLTDMKKFFSGPQEVIGSLNQSVTVVCCYGQAYKSYVKYWCKGNFSLCHVLVNTTGHDRISITDDQTQRAFTVTMTGLREDDKGQYYCAIETGEDSAEYFGVSIMHCFGLQVTKKNSPALEKVQRRASRLSPGLQGMI
uniref:Ig-like domain-containing protein n=1 Tax=Erpetoichthys calabaricus TaxID=27687 RepID=A0A8C4RS00_ERPCA